MKITTVTDEAICFDNNTAITFHHFEDCCEWNYADFLQLDDIARNYDFEENLKCTVNADFKIKSVSISSTSTLITGVVVLELDAFSFNTFILSLITSSV